MHFAVHESICSHNEENTRAQKNKDKISKMSIDGYSATVSLESKEEEKDSSHMDCSSLLLHYMPKTTSRLIFPFALNVVPDLDFWQIKRRQYQRATIIPKAYGRLMLSAGNQQIAVIVCTQVDGMSEPKVFGKW